MYSAFCPRANFQVNKLSIQDKDEVHHLKNVLRLKPKQKITIFNGEGEEALAEIITVCVKEITVRILSSKKTIKTSPYIILACAIPKKSKFETIIEKATELGVDEIIPLKTQRTEIKISEDKMDKKIQRFNTIAINAVKQCKRTTVPKIHKVMKFSSALKYLESESIILMPSLSNDRKNLIQCIQKLKNPQKISVFIGPEGDFTSKEYSTAHNQGAIPITLGETILRVETAAITSVACLNFFYAKNIQE